MTASTPSLRILRAWRRCVLVVLAPLSFKELLPRVLPPLPLMPRPLDEEEEEEEPRAEEERESCCGWRCVYVCVRNCGGRKGMDCHIHRRCRLLLTTPVRAYRLFFPHARTSSLSSSSPSRTGEGQKLDDPPGADPVDSGRPTVPAS